jgi:hypothetical protein
MSVSGPALLSHRQVAAALRNVLPGQTTEVLNVVVTREPVGDRYCPAGGRYRIAGCGETLLLLRAVDEVARQAGYKALAGDVCDADGPWDKW